MSTDAQVRGLPVEPPSHQAPKTLGPVEAAIEAMRRGEMVLVVDDEDRENEGDLIMAAEYATPETMAFMIRNTTGLLCVAVTEARAAELRLPLMVATGDDPRGTAFTVSVDLKSGTTTGVSATDRSLTVRALADPATRPEHLSRPGHVFPLIARPGGVLQRPGHTESTVDLCRLADLEPVGVLAEVTDDDGSMARRPALRRFAAQHRLVTLSVDDIIRYRGDRESLVERTTTGRVPSDHGEFRAICYRSVTDGTEHAALVMGDVRQRESTDEPVLVRVHSECLSGDVFGSHRCDCGEQLASAMAAIGRAGHGVIVYLRGHEGRGIGLAHKLRAYTLQDAGLDTVDANLAQGLPGDSRGYGISAQILADLGVFRIRLMTDNPAKGRGPADHRVDIVDREPLVGRPNPNNLHHLTTKHIRLNHAMSESEVS
nr:bifunctional 3,4-dihydroxy-2-butanone-4-phosphate synthase/GTP cyclohydrolase II [Frankia gtarii]